MPAAGSVSPFAPAAAENAPPLPGITLRVGMAGIRRAGKVDLLHVTLPPGSHAGGVLTRSRTAAAPVEWCRHQLRHGVARALVVNSGVANAFTGAAGVTAVEATAAAAAQSGGCQPHEVFIASTGVIGEPLEASRITAALPGLAPASWQEAAAAIMTTDTYPKLAQATAEVGGVVVRLVGIAKGSGMIAPDMATMLAFVFTDAAIAGPALNALAAIHAETTFNAITVDGDTSTSDTLLLFATGTSGAPIVLHAEAPEARVFSAALHGLMQDLALQVVKDGEGITKLIEVTVEGAASDMAARRIAFAVANSPLVKTAVAGGDANWGRVVMAVGKAGEAANRDKLAIWFGDIQVAADGARTPGYSEAAATAHVAGHEIAIRVDAGTGGTGRARVWGCDLTHGYIDINGSYRS